MANVRGNIMVTFLFACSCVLCGLWLQTISHSLLLFWLSLEVYSSCSIYLYSYGTWYGSLFGGLQYYSSTVVASLLLVCVWVLLVCSWSNVSVLWVLSLSLNYGIAPFHWWVLWVYEHISWYLLVWVVYLPKLILLWVSSYSFPFASWVILSWSNMLLGSVTPLSSVSLKRFLVVSSLVSFGTLLVLSCISGSSQDIVVSYYLLYTVSSFYLISTFLYNGLCGSAYMSLCLGSSESVGLFLFIVVVSSLPPFILWSVKLWLLFQTPLLVGILVLIYSFLYSIVYIRWYVLCSDIV